MEMGGTSPRPREQRQPGSAVNQPRWRQRTAQQGTGSTGKGSGKPQPFRQEGLPQEHPRTPNPDGLAALVRPQSTAMVLIRYPHGPASTVAAKCVTGDQGPGCGLQCLIPGPSHYPTLGAARRLCGPGLCFFSPFGFPMLILRASTAARPAGSRFTSLLLAVGQQSRQAAVCTRTR